MFIDSSKLKPVDPAFAEQWIGDDPEPPHYFKQVRKAVEVREARETALAAADRYGGLQDGIRLASAVWGVCLIALAVLAAAAGIAVWIWSATSGLPALITLAPITLGVFVTYRAIAYCLARLRDYRAHVQVMNEALDRFHILEAEYKELDKKTVQGIVPVESTEAPPFLEGAAKKQSVA